MSPWVEFREGRVLAVTSSWTQAGICLWASLVPQAKNMELDWKLQKEKAMLILFTCTQFLTSCPEYSVQ